VSDGTFHTHMMQYTKDPLQSMVSAAGSVIGLLATPCNRSITAMGSVRCWISRTCQQDGFSTKG